MPQIFDEDRHEWTRQRTQLRTLLGADEWAAARRTTINAHYTDPAYVAVIWDAVQGLGFEAGRVLEPGAGAGTFIGMAPPGAELTGVELDPTTAAIARALYPDATILAESFAQTRRPAAFFDVTIGNVPFADVALHDPVYNRGHHSIHNHFILRSLALTRPGGLVAVLTSHYTLDARNPAARREMSARADLLGAVRLPSGAHRRAAGTDVVTDLLVFRVREPGTPARATDWEATRAVTIDGEELRVNSYFLEHPDRMLGDVGVGHGAYNAQSLTVTGDLAATPELLASALDAIVQDAVKAGLSMTTRAATDRPAEPVARSGDDRWEGHITAHPDGTFSTIASGAEEPLEVPRSQHGELRQLLGVRDAARSLLTTEAAALEDTVELDALRADLRTRYSAYTARYGPINRFTLRPTGHSDPGTGEARMSRVVPRVMSTLRQDPFASLVAAVEVFDEQTQTATPAALLTQRVVMPRTPVLGVDTVEDALAVSLETHGRVDLPAIAQLLGQDEPETRRALGELVYTDPATTGLIPAAEYLSGNVRVKLDVATTAAALNPELAVNVTALQAVLPAPLNVDDVEARLGAVWIDAATHRDFLREVLGDETIVVEHPGAAVWEVRGGRRSIAATSTWGTQRMPATAIAKATLEQRTIQVFDKDADDKRILNPGETTAAQEKAEALQERFADWVWEEPGRSAQLLAEYNRRFNSLVLRDYAVDGERLTLPGLASTFQPHAHQRAAVARMIGEPAVGLFHEVGAGKTAEMVMGVMELRRLGLVNKPAIVVPNHMLEQFSREWLQLYPQARLLAASSQDLTTTRRRQFVARVATNDWDAIVMTRTAFERVPLSDEAQREYIRGDIDGLREMLTSARAADGLSVKRIEKMLLSAEERITARLDAVKDPGITFEATGIDYLGIDEMHDYKNLATASNIRDAAIEGSKRAEDLLMKTEYLRGRHGDRVITAMTATPIANSVTETHVMQRFLRPDLLRDAGVESFDAWAATFGRLVTEIEMAPTGAGNYRQKTRFARFQNVPELLRMWSVFADVKTAEDLALPTPLLALRPDGQRVPRTIVIPASPEITAYVTQLGERADAVQAGRVEPHEDNMLKISTHGRLAALDVRLVTGEPSSTPSKLDAAAENIARLYHACRDRIYLDRATGEPSPTTGALQIVFCDLGTPSEHWNAYDELRDELVDRGVPRPQVRFIHEAHSDLEKGRLFAAARSGDVAILVGSTQKMGVGTNIQDRAVALHHLDGPWRPADVRQRDGRILRQGNQHKEVGIYRYVVEGSFDGYLWQTLERKARFIAQLMRGRLDMREIEDIGDNALSFSEVKALASGDPLILDKARADADVTRLERLKRAHERNLQALRGTTASAAANVRVYGDQLPAVEAAITARTDTRGDAFRMTVGSHDLGTRADAAEEIQRWITTTVRQGGGLPYGRSSKPLGQLGELAGLPIDATLRQTLSNLHAVDLALRGLPTQPATMMVNEAREDARSLVRQLEHRIGDLPDLAQRIRGAAHEAAAELQRAKAAAAVPFKYAEALTDAQTRSATIAATMQERSASPPAPDPQTAEVVRLTNAAFPTPPAPSTRPGTARPPGRRSAAREPDRTR